MSNKSAKYLKANTAGSHFGILDSITPSDSATYLAAGEWSPSLQVTKVYLTGTTLNAGTLQGLY